MNSDRMPAKVRYIAAILHLIFAVSKLPVLLIFSLKPEPIFLSFALIFVRPIIVWIFWLITSKIDRFVDLAGRDIINYSLNNLVLSLWFGLPLAICVLGVALAAFSSISSYKPMMIFFGIGFGILFCIEVAYLIHAVVASIFAIRGHRFQSRRIHHFVRAE